MEKGFTGLSEKLKTIQEARSNGFQVNDNHVINDVYHYAVQYLRALKKNDIAETVPVYKEVQEGELIGGKFIQFQEIMIKDDLYGYRPVRAILWQSEKGEMFLSVTVVLISKLRKLEISSGGNFQAVKLKREIGQKTSDWFVLVGEKAL